MELYVVLACRQNANCQGSCKMYLLQLLFESTAAPSTRCEPGAAPPHLLHWSASLGKDPVRLEFLEICPPAEINLPSVTLLVPDSNRSAFSI